MSPQRLTEILKCYRSSKARCAYLQSQMQMLTRFLTICENSMVDDQVTMSQAITGMPHGSSIGDPTGRLAMDIASGKVTPFVQQIRDEMVAVQMELMRIAPGVRTVEIVLDAMNERERTLLEMKMIDGCSWAEILDKMRRRFNNNYSKRTLQRLLDNITEKACEIVR